jgi:hypothetical protein
MKRTIFNFIFVLFSLWVLTASQAVRAQAGGEEALVLDAPPFVLCERDDECEPIVGICGVWVGVNSALREEAIEILSELNNYRNCKPVPLKKPEKLGCNAGQCDIRPDKENCMLRTPDGKCEIRCDTLTPEGFCQKGCMIGVDCQKP